MPPALDSHLSADTFKKLKIVVIGDIMLDRYIYGEVTRISPESPVPILAVTRETEMLGGAGNVLANLAGLGIEVAIIAGIGADPAGQKIKDLCKEKASGTDGLLSLQRPTVVKTRLIGNGQQMLREDREDLKPLSQSEEAACLAALKAALQNAQALILSDYGKGTLTPTLIAAAIAEAKAKKIPVLVDPKGRDYSIYKDANVVTPNRRELSDATHGSATATDLEMEKACRTLLETSGIEAVVATRSADGMTILANSAAQPAHLKTEAREVFDVSGAGDTVIATLAAGLALGLDLMAAANLANKAAGIVVARAGTAAISATDLFAAKSGSWTECKDALAVVKDWKTKGLKVGFTNGCFDILHAGHVEYLTEARGFCDRLVLALNHDNSVRILKGPTRPVNDEESRATVIAGLKAVDLVVLFGAERPGEDNTPVKLIKYLEPDIFFKGGDYTEDQLPEAKIVRAYGGNVKLMGVVEGKSTTNIIKKIASA